jgi:hypothetical protein
MASVLRSKAWQEAFHQATYQQDPYVTTEMAARADYRVLPRAIPVRLFSCGPSSQSRSTVQVRGGSGVHALQVTPLDACLGMPCLVPATRAGAPRRVARGSVQPAVGCCPGNCVRPVILLGLPEPLRAPLACPTCWPATPLIASRLWQLHLHNLVAPEEASLLLPHLLLPHLLLPHLLTA